VGSRVSVDGTIASVLFHDQAHEKAANLEKLAGGISWQSPVGSGQSRFGRWDFRLCFVITTMPIKKLLFWKNRHAMEEISW